MRASHFARLGVLVAILVSACGGNAPTSLSDGTYSYTLTKVELASQNLDGGQLCTRSGTLSLSIKGDRWNMNKSAAPGCFSGNMWAEGTWKSSGDKAQFHSDRARYQPIESGNCNQDFTYTWSYNGKELRFTPVEDSCVLRVAHFTAYPWVVTK